MNRISRLQYITQDLPNKSHPQQVIDACEGGVQWVQLRIKDMPTEQVMMIAQSVKKICASYHAQLIINDYVSVAKTIGADGVHLGKSDMLPREAREILGPQAIIGATANSLADVQQLLTEPIDYIGLGPFRFTTTKKNLAPILGEDGFRKIALWTNSRIPLIGIGGIGIDDVETVLQTGLYGIAVSSAINLAGHPAEATRQLLAKLP